MTDHERVVREAQADVIERLATMFLERYGHGLLTGTTAAQEVRSIAVASPSLAVHGSAHTSEGVTAGGGGPTRGEEPDGGLLQV